MKTKGIKLDVVNNNLYIKLQDILDEIDNGKYFKWSILFLDGIPHLSEGRSILSFQNQVNTSEKGIFIEWEGLKMLATKFQQIIDVLIIGSKSQETLVKYKNDQEMYESCDYVIEMIDGGSWEIFSSNFSFIDRLGLKFEETKLLESDFQNEWLKKDSS